MVECDLPDNCHLPWCNELSASKAVSAPEAGTTAWVGFYFHSAWLAKFYFPHCFLVGLSVNISESDIVAWCKSKDKVENRERDSEQWRL